jgi:hypothetical protein
MTLNLNIKEIKINLKTNIEELKYVIFDIDMFYFSKEKKSKINSNLNKYPYFTSDLLYPYEELEKLSHTDIVNIFFNKNKFNDYLINYYKNNPKKNNEFQGKEENKLLEKYKRKNETIKNNIMIMLELLFPTNFPDINNIKNSFDIITSGLILKKQFVVPFESIEISDYSYMNFEEFGKKIFTTTKIIWLNDILNHPDYKELIKKYGLFIDWANKEKNKLEVLFENYKKNKKKYADKLISVGKKLDFIKKLIDSPYEKLKRITDLPIEYNDILPNVYKNISDTYKYKKNNESSNFLLQELINNDDEITSKEYYKLLDFIQKNYIEQIYGINEIILQQEDNKENDDKKLNELEEEFEDEFKSEDFVLNLMDVGITYNTTNQIEIYIMIDFVDKKIDKVKIENDCKFMSEYLGTELERYLKEKKTNKKGNKISPFWDVENDRVMITVKKNNNQFENNQYMNNDMNNNVINDEFENNQYMNNSNEPTFHDSEFQKNNFDTIVFEKWFHDHIFDDFIKKKIKEINQSGIKNINNDNLFSYIENSYHNFYDILKQIFEYNNSNIVDDSNCKRLKYKLNQIKITYENENMNYKNRLNDENKKQDKNIEKIAQYKNTILKYDLILSIIINAINYFDCEITGGLSKKKRKTLKSKNKKNLYNHTNKRKKKLKKGNLIK